MPQITNISLANLSKIVPNDNTILIQIVDPSMDFPTHNFKESYQFKFSDPDKGKSIITNQQAKELVDILSLALERNKNVVSHCVAGICRSGAITEIGVMMGFEEIKGIYRQPNILVKQRMKKYLTTIFAV